MLVRSNRLCSRSYVYLYPQVEAILESIRNYGKLRFIFYFVQVTAQSRVPISHLPQGPIQKKIQK